MIEVLLRSFYSMIEVFLRSFYFVTVLLFSFFNTVSFFNDFCFVKVVFLSVSGSLLEPNIQSILNHDDDFSVALTTGFFSLGFKTT